MTRPLTEGELAQRSRRRAATVRRGLRILELRAEGLTTDEVCERLGITYRQANYAWRKVARPKGATRAP